VLAASGGNAANLAPVPILPGKTLEISLGGLTALLTGGCGLSEEPRPEGGPGGLTGGLGVAGAGRGPSPRNFAGHGGLPAAGDACAVTGCGRSCPASCLTWESVDGGMSVRLRGRGVGVALGQNATGDLSANRASRRSTTRQTWVRQGCSLLRSGFVA
jgi:hypothetical protein